MSRSTPPVKCSAVPAAHLLSATGAPMSGCVPRAFVRRGMNTEGQETAGRYTMRTALSRGRLAAAWLSLVLVGMLLLPAAASASGANEWTSAGGDLQNTRNQASENKLSVANVGGLTVKWAFTTGGDVSATPAVDGNTVYVPDWAGNLYAVDKGTGVSKWTASIAAASGVPFDKARATPVVTERQGDRRHAGIIPFGGGRRQGARVRQVHRALLWSTDARLAPGRDHHAVGEVFDGRVYVGVASQEEALAAFVPGYVLQLPGQHARPGSRDRRDRVEDLHGAARIHGQRGLGKLAGDRHEARPGLHRAPETTTRCPPDVLALRRGRTAATRRERAACLAPDDHFDCDHGPRHEDRCDPLGDPRASLRRLDGRLHPVPRRRRPTAPSRRAPTTTSVRPPLSSRSRRARASRPSSSAPARRVASTGRSTPTPAP